MPVWTLPTATNRTVTLAEMRGAVRTRGDYENSDVFPDTLLTEWVNDALAEVYDLLVQTWEDYYTAEAALVTTIGNAAVALPTTFYKLLGVDWLNGGEYEALPSHRLRERNRYGATTGRPQSYRIQGAELRLQPVPDAVYTLRLLVIPSCPKLAAAGDLWDGVNGYEALVIEKVLLLCDAREERPLGDRVARIQQLEARVRSAANARDAGEPYYFGGRDEDGDP